MSLLTISAATMAMAAVNAATITLTTSDGSGKSSFDTWNVSGGGTDAPSADNDYVVSDDRYIRIIWNRTFGGTLPVAFALPALDGTATVLADVNARGLFLTVR